MKIKVNVNLQSQEIVIDAIKKLMKECDFKDGVDESYKEGFRDFAFSLLRFFSEVDYILKDKENKIYGITHDGNLVYIELCKCDKCKKRGMYECLIYFINDNWCDSIRLDKLNELLCFVSSDFKKVEEKWLLL